MKSSREIYEGIRRTVNSLRINDTHEHLPQEEERVASKADPFGTLLRHYASSDLVSSGMPHEELEEIRNPELPLDERWEKLSPYMDDVQNTGYWRAIQIALRDLYGIEEISKRTYKSLAERMEEANKPGLYSWVLREKASIDRIILDTSLLDPVDSVNKEFFSPVVRFKDFIMVRDKADLEALKKRCGFSIHTLNDLTAALEREFEKVAGQVVGVKIGLAYMRSIHFDKVTFREAEEVFNNIYKRETLNRYIVDRGAKYVPEGVSLSEGRPLQDYMVHKVIQLASRRGLPVQIHTGLQEGNENVITHSNPTHLINLFREYGEVKFDIFHGAYPYTGELGALAKNFPNVYIDMCWLHIISPSLARRALSEWLDAVPANKILGFGGDYGFVEGVYGHSVMARENVTKVLAEKVEEGSLKMEHAGTVAWKILRGNAEDLFFKRESADVR